MKRCTKILKQKFITTGSYVQKFEQSFKKKVKSKYAFTCSNATAGLQLAFMSINLTKMMLSLCRQLILYPLIELQNNEVKYIW